MTDKRAKLVYWIGGVTAMTLPAWVRARWPLSPCVCPSSQSPDGTRCTGVYVGRPDTVVQLGSDPWTWCDVGAAGEDVQIGMVGPVSPSYFARDPGAMLFPSFSVRLGDGQEWMIPIANPMLDSCALPSVERCSRTGTWRQEVKAEYNALSEYALDLANQATANYHATGSPSVDDATGRDMLAKAVAVNYDLAPCEMGALGLFDRECYAGVVLALIDWPGISEQLEAGTTDGNPTGPPAAAGDTANGGTGEVATTGPPAPISG